MTAGDSDACLTIENEKDFTIDLNGHTLSRGRTTVDDNGSVIVVKSGASLTVMDSSGDNSGKITGGYSKNGGAIINEGTLTIEGGTITENVAAKEGGAIYNKGTLAVSGGSINNNVSEDGGGIFNGGTATVTGVTITGNSAINAGSGIFDQGTLYMKGSPIIKDNFGDDVFLSAGKKIHVFGVFTSAAQIGVTSAAEKAVVTDRYGTYNSSPSSDIFFENGVDSAAVVVKDGEVKLNTEGVAYIDRAWNAEQTSVTKEIRHLTDYITASDSLSGLSGDNWYVVKGDVTVSSRVENSGRANILLCDGATINFKKGIRNQNNMESELNIYAQQTGSGKLNAYGEYDKSPIGPQNSAKGGMVNIYGGTIYTDYGIGSAYKSAGGVVRIYGANVRTDAIGCGSESKTDTSVYIGIFGSTIRGSLHNGAVVL